MTSLLADVNIQGHIDILAVLVQAEPWREFWDELGANFLKFDEVGLRHNATDADIWKLCQDQELVLLTNNRNDDGPDSLEATIRAHNTDFSLPVLTIGNAEQIKFSREYADRVIESILDVLDRIDDLRGTGRLFIPW